jgi:ParB family chromosome partitioning protein
LLDLPPAIQEAIQVGAVSEGHGRALLGLASETDKMLAAWQAVVDGGLTVRETERLVREANTPAAPAAPVPSATARRLEPNLRAAQERIQDALATRVRIRPSADGGGRIEIRYSSGDELERLLEALASLGGAEG